MLLRGYRQVNKKQRFPLRISQGHTQSVPLTPTGSLPPPKNKIRKAEETMESRDYLKFSICLTLTFCILSPRSALRQLFHILTALIQVQVLSIEIL